MRISSQQNQFIWQLPQDFMPKYLNDDFQLLMDKNFIPYDSSLDYINSTIKEIVFPSLTFEMSSQINKRGKKVNYKEAGNVIDKFSHDLDITFRSVDSHLNYFMLMQILIGHYTDVKNSFIPMFNIDILDKDGDVIYSVLFSEIIIKSIGEQRMSYQIQDFAEKTFTVTFSYNWIDITWNVHEKTRYLNDVNKSIFDIPDVIVPSGRKIDENLIKNHHKEDKLIDNIPTLPHIKDGKNIPNHQID